MTRGNTKFKIELESEYIFYFVAHLHLDVHAEEALELLSECVTQSGKRRLKCVAASLPAPTRAASIRPSEIKHGKKMAKVSKRARDRPRRRSGQIFQMFGMRLPAASLKFRDDRLIIVNKLVEYGSRCTHTMSQKMRN